MKHGIGYLSEDRKQYGIVVSMSVADNIVQPSLDNYIKKLLIDDKLIHQTSEEYVESMKIKTSSTHQLLKNLSGGNQQKVVISKWLAQDNDILIFDEPTRGIDVGAKSEIYSLMNELVKKGKSIRSEEHTSELQSRGHLVCRLLLEKTKT